MVTSIEAIKKTVQEKQVIRWKRTTLQNIFFLENALGAMFFNQKISPKYRNKYLNLGCGDDKFDNWVNADLYKFYNIMRGRATFPDWMLDATKSWNCPDDFWGGIYCSHIIEHIKYLDVVFLFSEAYRTLQKGKFIRIVVPDLGKYVEYYNQNSSEAEFQKYSYRALAISDLTQSYGHISVWDEDLLMALLQESGFINVKKTEYQQGSDENLLQDVHIVQRKWESLYVEAQKP